MEHALDQQQQFNAARAHKRGQDDVPLDELAGSVQDKVPPGAAALQEENGIGYSGIVGAVARGAGCGSRVAGSTCAAWCTDNLPCSNAVQH